MRIAPAGHMAQRRQPHRVRDRSRGQCADPPCSAPQAWRSFGPGPAASRAAVWSRRAVAARAAASHATEAGIADLCDVSLLERLQNAGDYLADIHDHLLAHRRGGAATAGRLQLNLVDGSTVSRPGSDGSDWRLHARYEPARGCFTDLLTVKSLPIPTPFSRPILTPLVMAYAGSP